jgi:hypothetical protein
MQRTTTTATTTTTNDSKTHTPKRLSETAIQNSFKKKNCVVQHPADSSDQHFGTLDPKRPEPLAMVLKGHGLRAIQN